MITLFHGSNQIVENPRFGYGRQDCDYGSGFYMSDDKQMAAMWASQYPDGGYINTYSLDPNGLRVLYLNHATKEDVLAWVATLCAHRIDEQTRASAAPVVEALVKRFAPPLEEYDMVIGYRADDSYYQYTAGFLNGSFPLELLLEAMKAGQLGLQYVLLSKKAFSATQFVSAEEVPNNESYERLTQSANKEYEKLRSRATLEMTYVRDLLRENI